MENRRHSFAASGTYQQGLHRRQIKSRSREVVSPHEFQRLKYERVPKRSGPISLFIKCVQFNSSERSFADVLHNYLMTPEEMSSRGYPTRSDQVPDRVFVFKSVPYGPGNGQRFDSSCATDLVRTCSRCTAQFCATAAPEKCCYHWGKPNDFNEQGHSVYICCRGQVGSIGCTERDYHVWDGLFAGLNGPYSDYVFTKPRRGTLSRTDHDVYALDSEMSYTIKGLELTKVTVVAMDGRLVYESYVRPDNEIVDHNTSFSGITAKDMRRPAIKNLRDVQRDLLGFISADTVLIGHALENDLRALKIVHDVVVDTSHIFPHMKGLPFRRSLKSLTSTTLNRDIQCGADGHDSFEDACACMELVLWRVKSDSLERSQLN